MVRERDLFSQAQSFLCFSVITFSFCLFSFTPLLKLINHYLSNAYYMLSTGLAGNYECPIFDDQ